MTDINTASLESWQTWLAIEHEAVWLGDGRRRVVLLQRAD